MIVPVSIDVLTNNIELFTENGADHDDEMKEMLHHLETMISEALSSTGESRFTTMASANEGNLSRSKVGKAS